jgi:hypothetical protein
MDARDAVLVRALASALGRFNLRLIDNPMNRPPL